MRAARFAGTVVVSVAVVTCLGLLTGGAAERSAPASQDPRSAEAPAASRAAGTVSVKPLPNHLAQQTAVSWDYRYASVGQSFFAGRRPNGAGATFTVHAPGDFAIDSGSHSLAELAIHKPGSGFTFVEAGWVRGNYDGQVRLFVYWWDNAGIGRCYNFECPGFVRSGRGLRPGAVLQPGTTIRLEYVHRNGAWWLLVNGRYSGYYPDRLWAGRFTRADDVQVFGEVAIPAGRPFCIDMGNGRFPSATRGASLSRLSVYGTPDAARFVAWTTTPRHYTLYRVSATHWKYGGPGAC